MAVLYWSWV